MIRKLEPDSQGEPFAQVSLEVLRLPLTDRQRRVLIALIAYGHNDASLAWPSVATLAGATGVDARHVQRALRKLETLKLITVIQVGGGRQQPTRYRVEVERVAESAPVYNPNERAAKSATVSDKRVAGLAPKGRPSRPPKDRMKRENNISGFSEVKDDSAQVCPKCGGRLQERSANGVTFLGCSNYRRLDCRYTRDLLSGAEVPTAKCDRCYRHVPLAELEVYGTHPSGQTWRWCPACRDRETKTATGAAGTTVDNVPNRVGALLGGVNFPGT